MSHQPPGPPPPPFTPPPRPPSTGALAWGLGLLALACVPFVSSIVASVVMVVVGRSQRSRGELAAQNGRNAANWGLTYLIATVVLVGGHFALLFALTRDEPVHGFFPLGIPITLWGVVSLAHLVICIVGLVKASQQKVFRAPAVPFLR